jgi:hypothetical protein
MLRGGRNFIPEYCLFYLAENTVVVAALAHVQAYGPIAAAAAYT